MRKVNHPSPSLFSMEKLFVATAMLSKLRKWTCLIFLSTLSLVLWYFSESVIASSSSWSDLCFLAVSIPCLQARKWRFGKISLIRWWMPIILSHPKQSQAKPTTYLHQGKRLIICCWTDASCSQAPFFCLCTRGPFFVLDLGNLWTLHSLPVIVFEWCFYVLFEEVNYNYYQRKKSLYMLRHITNKSKSRTVCYSHYVFLVLLILLVETKTSLVLCPSKRKEENKLKNKS